MDPRAVPMAPGCLPEPGDTLTCLIKEARSAAKGAWHLWAWACACSGYCLLRKNHLCGLAPDPWWNPKNIQNVSFLLFTWQRQPPGLIF